MSTSSSSTTGFIEPASLMARTMRPGSAPTYVRRWPRISASSRTPPRATRTNFRPSVRATDSPSEVLPTPGGPASRITAPLPRPPTTVEAALRPRRARTARYSTIRSFTSSSPWWSASSTARAAVERRWSRRSWCSTGSSSTVSSQVRIHAASGFWSLDRSSLSTSRSAASRTASGSVGRLDPGPVVVRAVGLALAELLADRVRAAGAAGTRAALLHRLADVLADLVADLDLGQVVAGPLDEQLEPPLDVGRLEQLALALVGEVRRPAGRVGDLLGVGRAR